MGGGGEMIGMERREEIGGVEEVRGGRGGLKKWI